MKQQKILNKLLYSLIVFTLLLTGCSKDADKAEETAIEETATETVKPTSTPISSSDSVIESTNETLLLGYPNEFDLSVVPDYTGSPYAVINENAPYFTSKYETTTSYKSFSDLDDLGRCGVAVANIGLDIMPTEKASSIGMIKPTGWQTVRYDDVISDNYLYNRCHLIAYQLSGEDTNEKNIITGTRYLNVEGMLPFENRIVDYVKTTSNHVLYRVTPIYKDSNDLIAAGVLMEAKSIEDNGAALQFNVFCYNIQPGITIDYATGDSALSSIISTASVEESAIQAKDIQESLPESTQETVQEEIKEETQQEEIVEKVQEEAPTETAETEELVWISRTGSKYHYNPNCSNMKKPKQVTLEYALSKHRKKCSNCWPD